MLEKKQLAPHKMDIWQVSLDQPETSLQDMLLLLSDDEKERAFRFHFPIHQQRFIYARAYLRLILSSYLNESASRLTFGYSTQEKPFLTSPSSSLQFNLSHSDDLAIYAVMQAQSVGIDIEKIKPDYTKGIAHRFFSPDENKRLVDLPEAARPLAFYQFWAKKEAIVKTIGKGLLLPLASFSVSLGDQPETIQLTGYPSLRLIPLNLHPDYSSAVCCEGVVQKMSIYKMLGQTPQLVATYDF